MFEGRLSLNELCYFFLGDDDRLLEQRQLFHRSVHYHFVDTLVQLCSVKFFLLVLKLLLILVDFSYHLFKVFDGSLIFRNLFDRVISC